MVKSQFPKISLCLHMCFSVTSYIYDMSTRAGENSKR